eukprot:CAMPEP_0204850208 /NCGR_PEP_ID=MMETSP1347-20130617/7731_1 /ASSEMBLY_ACC=CAM_ASM_000690 /TAXON_ID=215587 /ORGANISM="Aplanochytrium stocchinoi, Strain GSBS06" /LENGTH=56 /DNA_ID=CAMNT_0051993053 /DNA_START=59 /DNA_END=229 /DNA_ORIENTATION=-
MERKSKIDFQDELKKEQNELAASSSSSKKLANMKEGDNDNDSLSTEATVEEGEEEH